MVQVASLIDVGNDRFTGDPRVPGGHRRAALRPGGRTHVPHPVPGESAGQGVREPDRRAAVQDTPTPGKKSG